MERTRSAMMAVVGLAVTALAGCVAVEPHPGPVPRPETTSGRLDPGATSEAAKGSTADGAALRDRQARAKEALEAVSPAPTVPPASAPVPPPAAGRPAAEAPAAPPRHERQPAERQGGRLPAAPPTVRTAADVCALGESLGPWPEEGPQARICREIYGR
ncbi:hypothetical protein ACFY7Z_30285 [Streptomyces sp. NPDC012623]|uniref:hypothetical protein n=1 Tax=unclassified Streptomyces TaxID=2593676 RepID=UPI0036958D9D